MIKSMKRMVLTGAAVAVMMSFAAPAMALPNVVDGGPGVIGPVVDPPPPPPPNPLCDVTPIGCGNNPDPVLDPGDNPVAEPPPPPPPPPPGNTPPENTPPGNTPPENTPPENTPPPDNTDPRDEESDTGGSGGSSGGSSGGPLGSASETIDRGGTIVSSFLPTTLTSTIGDVGNSMKKNLPAPVAKSLPNTGGGWSFLVLVAAGLIAGGFLIRSIVRRTTGVTRTAQ